MPHSHSILRIGFCFLIVPTLVLAGGWDQPLNPVFDQAAADYTVPAELLLTLAKMGSAFENRGAEPTIEEGYGIMALRANSLGGTSLADAARLTGVDVETLKIDPVANIRGAAAVLDEYATEANIDRSLGLDGWEPVIMRYAALDTESSRIFTWQVYDRLQKGFEVTNNYGETFIVAPQPININLEAMAPPERMVLKAPEGDQAAQGGDAMSPDYGPAAWNPAPTCNYSTSSNSHDTVVIHTVEGSYAGCISWIKNCNSNVSAHYVVAEDGRITQMVREYHTAWHAGCYNYRSIGLEHEGYAASSSHPTSLYNASGDLVRDICNAYGIPKQKRTVGPGIIGHIDVTRCCCGTHTDPGNGWNWTYYIDRVNGGTPPPPAWAATFRAQSFPSTMVAGTTAIVWVEFNNTGTSTWYHCQTRLGTSSPQDRTSPFCTPNNWRCADGSNPGCHRPTDVDQSAVTTGQVGRFTFIITAPASPGTYVEKYKLVREGVTWFGPEVSATITVTAATGNLTGTVRNAANGTAIAGASVTLSGVGTTTTNSSGVYSFNNVNAGSYTVSVSATGFSPASSSVTISADATATKDFNLTVPDTQAPTTPTNLHVTSTTSSSVSLAWTAATDNIGVASYEIRRNGGVVGSSASTTYNDAGLSSNSAYTYEVRAKDAAGNPSGWSNSAVGYTKPAQVTVFSDGFNGSLSNWAGVTAFSYSGAVNHGSLSGAGAAYFPAGTGQNASMYRSLSKPFAQGKVSGYFYDAKGGWKPSVCGNSYRQALSLRDFDGAAKMYIDNEFYNTPDNSKYYFRTLWTGGPNAHTVYATRDAATDCNPAWVYFETTVNPGAAGASPTASAVLKVTDRAGTGTTTQNLGGDYFAYGIGRVHLGLGISSTNDGYWDDIRFEATPPNIPSMGAPGGITASQIQWTFSAGDNNNFGYDVADEASSIISPQWPAAGWIDHNATSWTETGLTANKTYTRKVRAWNGTLNSFYSAPVSATTLSVPPGAGSITVAPASGCLNNQLVWTAVNGFGEGQVEYYRYAWTQEASHSFSGGEPVWSSGTIATTPSAGGTWYLHVQGFNAEDVANGTFSYAITVSEPGTTTASSNTPVCVGGTLMLTASPVEGATYSWTGPNGFTSSEQNPSISGVTMAAIGTYSVTATVDGCSSPPAMTDVDVIECGPPVEIVAWRSIRTHGSEGELAMSLDPSLANVEPRAGSVQKIEVEFNQAVTLIGPVSVKGRSTVDGVLEDEVDYSEQATSTAAGTVVTITFPAGALPDATCYVIDLDGKVQSLQGPFLNRESTDTDCIIRSLAGDIDGSGDVSVADLHALRDKAAAREPNSAVYDVTCSGGNINLGDALLAHNRLGRVALCP